MLINIELKGPFDEVWYDSYDFNRAAQLVIALVDKYDVAERVMISSFVPRILESIIAESPATRKFVI